MYTSSKTCEVLYCYKINATKRNMNFTTIETVTEQKHFNFDIHVVNV